MGVLSHNACNTGNLTAYSLQLSVFPEKSELVLFGFCIIPLAQKLNSCVVFGVSGDEYLNSAPQNRSECDSKGRVVVDAYIQAYVTEEA